MDAYNDTAAGGEAKASMRSCTTCSKAKAKCVRRSGQEICERCCRLKKDCQSREPVLRRRKVVKTTRAAQLEKLENKIEHLVNALSTTQAQRGFSIDYGQPSPPISQASDRSATGTGDRQTQLLQAMCDPGDGAETDTPSSAADIVVPTASSAIAQQCKTASGTDTGYATLGVSMSEADILLDRYQRLMAQGVPFVVIPATTTAQQLWAESPFLLHVIVAVTYFHDLPKQQTMIKQLMRDVSERVLINNEKNLDIMKGLLVFASYYHPHIFWGQQITNLLHIAMAMSIDLGIDRPPHQCGNEFKSAHQAAHHKVHGPSVAPPPQRVPTLDEHRVLAGTYYLISMLASSFRKIEAMKFTPFLSEALTTLEQTAEYDSDLFLVQIVRLQHLIDSTALSEVPSAPMQMYVKAFNVDLERLRSRDPSKDPTNVFLRLQYVTAQILVWELALTDIQENKTQPLHSHLDHLYHCLEAISSWLEIFFTIPTNDYLTLPFSTFGQFAHAFIALIKLASLEVDGWDMKDLNEQLSFSKTIEEAAGRFEAATRSTPDGLKVNNDAFGKWAHRMRWMKSVYESKFTAESELSDDQRAKADANIARGPWNQEQQSLAQTPAADVSMSGLQQSQQLPTPPDDVLSADFFNYLDENFWQGFGTEFDLGFPVDSAMAMGNM